MNIKLYTKYILLFYRKTLVPAKTNQLDCLGNVVEADQWLEQQPIVENEPTSISQLRGRSTINLPDRYGP